MNIEDVTGALDIALTGRFAHLDPHALLSGLSAEERETLIELLKKLGRGADAASASKGTQK